MALDLFRPSAKYTMILLVVRSACGRMTAIAGRGSRDSVSGYAFGAHWGHV